MNRGVDSGRATMQSGWELHDLIGARAPANYPGDSAIGARTPVFGTSVFCTDFTCKIREYEFGLQNTEIELCQFCHLRYYCQNKAYLFWVANQSRFVVFYAPKPSNTSLITKTFILLSSTCGSNTCSSPFPVPVVPKESTRVSTGSQWVPPE